MSDVYAQEIYLRDRILDAGQTLWPLRTLRLITRAQWPFDGSFSSSTSASSSSSSSSTTSPSSSCSGSSTNNNNNNNNSNNTTPSPYTELAYAESLLLATGPEGQSTILCRGDWWESEVASLEQLAKEVYVRMDAFIEGLDAEESESQSPLGEGAGCGVGARSGPGVAKGAITPQRRKERTRAAATSSAQTKSRALASSSTASSSAPYTTAATSKTRSTRTTRAPSKRAVQARRKAANAKSRSLAKAAYFGHEESDDEAEYPAGRCFEECAAVDTAADGRCESWGAKDVGVVGSGGSGCLGKRKRSASG